MAQGLWFRTSEYSNIPRPCKIENTPRFLERCCVGHRCCNGCVLGCRTRKEEIKQHSFSAHEDILGLYREILGHVELHVHMYYVYTYIYICMHLVFGVRYPGKTALSKEDTLHDTRVGISYHPINPRLHILDPKCKPYPMI